MKDDEYHRTGTNYEGRLHFLNRPSNSLAAERNLLLQSMAHTASEWLEQCRHRHNRCAIKGATSLPTRLIDVSSKHTGRICLRLSDANELGSYAALSYCWGGSYNFVTTTENLASHLENIPEERLPLTLKQAVDFTRRLNIDYLWVDAICILQDSKEDKKREIRNMRTIFKNAYVTLVASHPPSVSDGFLFPQSTPMSSFFSIRANTIATGPLDILVELLPFSRIRHQPVNNRAWTMEERLLSSKLLIFSSYGLFWQCEEEDLSFEERILEDQDPNQIGHRIDVRAGLLNASEDIFFSSIVLKWFTLVSDYTSRSLTHFGDKMPAIAGIAEEFSQKWGLRLGEYKAGLWSNYLVGSLAWQTINGCFAEPLIKYRAPSWSWAAVESHVAIYPGSRGNKADFERRAKILNIQVETVHVGDPFGEIASGHITIQALTMDGNIIGGTEFTNSTKEGFFEDQRTGKHIKGGFSPDFKDAFENNEVEYRLVLAECYLEQKRRPPRGFLLVLVPSGGMGFYRRVGIFRSTKFLLDEHLFRRLTTTIV